MLLILPSCFRVLTKKQEPSNQSSALFSAPDTTAFSTSLGSFPVLWVWLHSQLDFWGFSTVLEPLATALAWDWQLDRETSLCRRPHPSH